MCPYGIAVWAAAIPAFWYVTLHNLGDGSSARFGVIQRNHGVVLTVWLLLVAAFILKRFWAPWNSVFV